MPIYKEANGTYTFRLYIKENGHAKQYKRRGFKSKHEAMEAMRLFQPFKDYESSLNSVKFGDKIEEFYAECSKVIKVTTLDDYKYAYNSHIASFFKNMYILSIEPKTLLKWQNILISKGLSINRCNAVLLVLKKIFQFYVDFYGLPKNPTLQIHSLKDNKSIIINKERVLERQDYELFINTFKSLEHRCIFEVMYKAGTRLSETRALTWSDIDFKEHTIKINKQVQYSSSGIIVSPPKSKTSVRTINMCKSLNDILFDYYLECLKCYNCDIKLLYVFGGMKPIGATNIDRLRLDHIKESKVHHFTNHELRHSYGSNLIHDGFDVKYVSMQMGHESIEITLKTYHHLLSDTAAINKAKYYDNY